MSDDTGRKGRVTFDKGRENEPRWSLDGSRIFYNHPEEGPDASIYSVDSDAGGERELVTAGQQISLARDGSHMVFSREEDDMKGDLWAMPLKGDGDATVFLQTEANESTPALSPDGRFVAYVSEESGIPRVYVKPFPEGSGEWQVSVEHGWRAFWSPAGDRLYYHDYQAVMEVQVSTDPVLRLGTPRIFLGPDETTLLFWKGIAIAKDGNRFAGIRNVETDDEDQDAVEEGIHVVLNWFSDFEE